MYLSFIQQTCMKSYVEQKTSIQIIIWHHKEVASTMSLKIYLATFEMNQIHAYKVQV